MLISAALHGHRGLDQLTMKSLRFSHQAVPPSVSVRLAAHGSLPRAFIH
jgi:hypothetical protein